MFDFLLYSALFVIAWPVIAAIGSICYVIGCGIWFVYQVIKLKFNEMMERFMQERK